MPQILNSTEFGWKLLEQVDTIFNLRGGIFSSIIDL